MQSNVARATPHEIDRRGTIDSKTVVESWIVDLKAREHKLAMYSLVESHQLKTNATEYVIAEGNSNIFHFMQLMY